MVTSGALSSFAGFTTQVVDPSSFSTTSFVVFALEVVFFAGAFFVVLFFFAGALASPSGASAAVSTTPLSTIFSSIVSGVFFVLAIKIVSNLF